MTQQSAPPRRDAVRLVVGIKPSKSDPDTTKDPDQVDQRSTGERRQLERRRGTQETSVRERGPHSHRTQADRGDRSKR